MGKKNRKTAKAVLVRGMLVVQAVKEIDALTQPGAKVPILVAMWLRGAARMLYPIFADLEEKRQELIEKYCERMNDGSRKVDEEDRVVFADAEGFVEEYSQLMDQEHPVLLRPLPIEAFKDMDVDATHVAALEAAGLIINPFVLEEEDEEEEPSEEPEG